MSLRPTISSNLGERQIKNTDFFSQYISRLKNKYQEDELEDHLDKEGNAADYAQLVSKSMFNTSSLIKELGSFVYDIRLGGGVDPVHGSQLILTYGKIAVGMNDIASSVKKLLPVFVYLPTFKKNELKQEWNDLVNLLPDIEFKKSPNYLLDWAKDAQQSFEKLNQLIDQIEKSFLALAKIMPFPTPGIFPQPSQQTERLLREEERRRAEIANSIDRHLGDDAGEDVDDAGDDVDVLDGGMDLLNNGAGGDY